MRKLLILAYLFLDSNHLTDRNGYPTDVVSDRKWQDGNMPQPQNSQEKGDADEELEDLDEGNFDRQGGFDYNEGVTDKNFAENLQELAEDMPEYHHPSYADVPELNLKNITIHHDVWIKDLEDFWNSPCYTDPNVEIDVHKGIERIRDNWIEKKFKIMSSA